MYIYNQNTLNDPNTPKILKFTKISLKLLKDLPNRQLIGYPIDYPIKPIYTDNKWVDPIKPWIWVDNTWVVWASY